MRSALDFRALIPIIKIDACIVQKVTAIAKSQRGDSDSFRVLIGDADFIGKQPMINFNQITDYSEEDEKRDLGPNQIPAIALFQTDGEINWSNVVSDYVQSNGNTTDYSSNYYFHGFCMITYTSNLEVTFYSVTPNVSLTITKLRDAATGDSSNRRAAFATYTKPHVADKFITTEFRGIRGPDDARIVSLSYSLGLAFDCKPIRASIGDKVYQIDTKIGDVRFYEGHSKVGRMGVTLQLTCDNVSVEEESKPVAETKVEGLLDSTGVARAMAAMEAKIARLEESIARQQAGIMAVVNEQEDETKRVLEEILERIRKQPTQEGESRKAMRFVVPKNIVTSAVKQQPATKSVKPALEIRTTMSWSRDPVAPEPCTPVRHSLVKSPARVSSRKSNEYLEQRLSQIEKSSRPPPKPQDKQQSYRRTDSTSGYHSNSTVSTGVTLPSSIERNCRPPHSGSGSHQIPVAGEQSFFLEPYSMESKTLFDMIEMNEDVHEHLNT